MLSPEGLSACSQYTSGMAVSAAYGKVPSTTDVVCIGVGKTVTVSEGTQQAGVLSVSGTLVISGGNRRRSS